MSAAVRSTAAMSGCPALPAGTDMRTRPAERSIGKCVACPCRCRDTASVTGSAVPHPLRPRVLKPGDLVVIAALSGPLHATDEPNLEQAVVVLEQMGFR